MNLFRLKPALLSILFVWQAAPQSTRAFKHFQYQRGISLARTSPAPAVPDQACAILDADVFAHAAPDLKDLRLYSGATETPYHTTVSEPPQQDTDDAHILNLRTRPGRIVFDLEMPRRPYTSVLLDLTPRDFIATAIVSGGATPVARHFMPLGNFTLFDLTSQHLARSTAIPLSESTFPYLHVELTLVPAPGSTSSSASLNLASVLKSASVPPSREAQSLYTATVQPKSLTQAGNDSTAVFKVPVRVPIERIAFTLPSGYKGDFSRVVSIEARASAEEDLRENSADGHEDTTGTILSVHRSEAGHDISAESLAIPVAIGSNMQRFALVEVRVENRPGLLPPLFVQLQMRQRRICFDAASATAPLTLYYGDPSLDAPAYGNASLSAAAPRIAQLAPEVSEPAFAAVPSPRRLSQHRPILRWIALLGCVCIFALLVIRSTHKRRR